MRKHGSRHTLGQSYRAGKPERTVVVALRVSPDEHARLVAEAEAGLLTISAYTRQRLFLPAQEKPGVCACGHAYWRHRCSEGCATCETKA